MIFFIPFSPFLKSCFNIIGFLEGKFFVKWEQKDAAASTFLCNDNNKMSLFKTFDSTKKTQKAQKDEKLVF